MGVCDGSIDGSSASELLGLTDIVGGCDGKFDGSAACGSLGTIEGAPLSAGVGPVDGMNEGATDGLVLKVGVVLGAKDGNSEGLALNVGIKPVGVEDATLVGPPLGISEGAALGNRVGVSLMVGDLDTVGVFDGETLTDGELGDWEGMTVGPSLGN